MKKKFIAVYALLGVLALGSTLTSCVDDNESASVTAVRDAKAASLNAMAALNNAKAGRIAVMAEADAAYRKAEAALKEAQAALKDLELQKAQATIETDIAAAQAAAEANLKKQQAALEKAEAELIESMDYADDVTKSRINDLLHRADVIMNGGSYNIYDSNSPGNTKVVTIEGVTYDKTKINSIDLLQQRKMDIQADQVKAKYGLVDIQEAIAEEIARQDEKIATQTALKEKYQALKETANDRETVEKEYADAKDALQAAEVVAIEKKQAEDMASKAKNEFSLQDTELMIAISNTSKYQTSYTNVNGQQIYINIWSYLDDVEENDELRKEIEFQYSNNSFGSVLYYADATVKYNSEQLSTDNTSLNRDIEVQTKIVADLTTQYTNLVNTEKTTILQPLQQAVETAKAAYEADKSPANKQALENAEAALNNYVPAQSLLPQKESAEEKLAELKEALEVLTSIKTLLEGNAIAAYNEKVKEANVLNDAYWEAHVEVMKANQTQTIANQLVNTLKSYVDATAPSTDLLPDWDALIEGCDKAIRDAEQAKEEAKGQFDKDGDGTPENMSEAAMNWYIEKLEAEAKLIDTQLNVQQSQYDAYLAQVNELIQNGGTTTPDTPSEETPEETPAE